MTPTFSLTNPQAFWLTPMEFTLATGQWELYAYLEALRVEAFPRSLRDELTWAFDKCLEHADDKGAELRARGLLFNAIVISPTRINWSLGSDARRKDAEKNGWLAKAAYCAGEVSISLLGRIDGLKLEETSDAPPEHFRTTRHLLLRTLAEAWQLAETPEMEKHFFSALFYNKPYSEAKAVITEAVLRETLNPKGHYAPDKDKLHRMMHANIEGVLAKAREALEYAWQQQASFEEVAAELLTKQSTK